MSDVHNHEHAKENKGVGPASSLRTVIGVIVSIIAVCLVMFAIFRVYSNELSDEFYDLASVSMDDYTAAQKVEVESFISEVSSVISTMCVLAESPDIDPSGSTFAAYLEEWNQQGSFQVTYTPIEELEQGVASNRNERDEETLRHLYAGETVVSDVRKSNRLNGYYFSIAKPVNRDGRVVGVLRSIVKAEKLLDTSQASSQVTLLGTLLIKEDGTVVPVSKEFEGYEGSTLYQVLEGRGVSSDQIVGRVLPEQQTERVERLLPGSLEPGYGGLCRCDGRSALAQLHFVDRAGSVARFHQPVGIFAGSQRGA